MTVIEFCKLTPRGAYIELILNGESKICDYSMKLTASGMITVVNFSDFDPNNQPYAKYANAEVTKIDQKLEIYDGNTKIVYMLFVDAIQTKVEPQKKVEQISDSDTPSNSNLKKPSIKKKSVIKSAEMGRTQMHYYLDRPGEYNLIKSSKCVKIARRRDDDNYTTQHRLQITYSEANSFKSDLEALYGIGTSEIEIYKKDSELLYNKWCNYISGVYSQIVEEYKEINEAQN